MYNPPEINDFVERSTVAQYQSQITLNKIKSYLQALQMSKSQKTIRWGDGTTDLVYMPTYKISEFINDIENLLTLISNADDSL